MKIIINNLNTDRDDIEYITRPLLTFINSYVPRASHREELPEGENMVVVFERLDTYIGVTCYYEPAPGRAGEVE